MSDNARRIISLLKDPEQMDPQMLQHMRQVADYHPYFTLAHALVAKGTHMLGEGDADEKIGKASLYVTDRGQLKRLIMGGGVSPPQVASRGDERAPASVQTPPAVDTAQVDAPSSEGVVDGAEGSLHTVEDTGHEQLLREVQENLEALKKSRASYAVQEDTIYAKEMADTLRRVKDSLQEELSGEEVVSEAEEKQRIVEALEAQGSRAQAAKHLGMSDKALSKKMEAYEIPMPKRTRGRAKSSPEASPPNLQDDLSVPSQQLETPIPSETLAKVYLKQGKIEKAIGVYEKIAYFHDERREALEQKIKELREQADN